MKTALKCLLLSLTGLLTVATPRVSADLEISASVTITAEADFYEPLTPHGAWVEVNSYGRVWRPSGITVEWRPYTTGEWVWTDYGWYWQSDEPWAWATYHYGRWTYHPRHHWVWVPGREWAPAWVSWRSGGGHIGWAPLPPRGGITFRAGISGPDFIFVQTSRFRQPIRPNTVIINNTTIINNTRVIVQEPARERRNVNGSQREVIINQGPPLKDVEKATGRKEQPVTIQQAAARTAVPEAVRSRPAKAPDNQPPPERKNPDKKDQPAPKPNLPKDPATPESPKPAPPPERPAPPVPGERKPVPPPESPKPRPPSPEVPKPSPSKPELRQPKSEPEITKPQPAKPAPKAKKPVTPKKSTPAKPDKPKKDDRKDRP